MMPGAVSPDQYIRELAPAHRDAVTKLRETISTHLPDGFAETMSYGMIGFVVPHSLYPAGYHANPVLPLPFINIASQKRHIALYHMALYADEELMKWFVAEYRRQTGKEPDMGKSCIRFRKTDEIPFDLIAELTRKITPQQWIRACEESRKR